MTAIRTLTRDQLDDICDMLNLDGDAARTTYIGRGMYGRTCIGFDVERSEIVAVGAALAAVLAQGAQFNDEVDLDDLLIDVVELCRSACVDSMGHGAIVYFPRITFAG